MSDLSQRISELPPEQRARLERRLINRDAIAAAEQAIPRRTTADSCALSFAQQRLWFLEQLEPNNAYYNVAHAMRVRGDLNTGALSSALAAIVARHEVLRTTFVSLDGLPAQVIQRDWSPDLTRIDLSNRLRPEGDEEIHRAINEVARRPFDLSRDAPLRAALVRLATNQHVLVLIMHHIASDGWSTGILNREIAAFYDAFVSGRPACLPDLPIQYADFALWQRRWLDGDRLTSQLNYWKQRLAGAPADCNLPTDRPRSERPTYRGARESLTLSKFLTERLQALSRAEGCTLFMALLATFQVLLQRYSRHEDIAVGTQIAGRNRVEIEGLIGCFVNSLVLRTDLSGNLTYRALLAQVREVTLGAYAHQDLPFEKLVEELQPTRNLSTSPLFQVMFQLLNVPSQPMCLRGLEVSEFPIDTGVALLDLSITVRECPEGLRCEARYNTDLFDRATIVRMLGHYQVLLNGIVGDPDRPVANLPLLTVTERHQSLIEWNQTASDFPHETCLHELFEAQAARSPGAVAVVFEHEQLTYGDLNAQSNRLAHRLRLLGVGPDVFVGICMERSVEMVVAMLGILKAGGAYVPLDPSYPKDRLAFMVQDSRAAVLLTQERLRSVLPNSSAQVLNVDRPSTSPAELSAANPTSGVRAANIAYVMYTSGSTGLPKGVLIPHGAIANHMLWMKATFPLTATDHVLQKTPSSADASVWEFFAPLQSGARLIMAQPDGHRDSEYIVQAISRHRVSVVQFVPSLLRAVVEEQEFCNCQSLRHVFCGGEALAGELVQRLFDRSVAQLHNLYGPTEAAIDSTWFTCARDDARPGVPIGRPIANTQHYVLDRAFEPVPVGVPGELYIGGRGLARGYLNRPDLTAERFIPDPFSAQPGARLYRTGDLVRYLHSGNIEFLGRLDHQIKIRGFRIEPGEIEAVLRQHDGVADCAVVAREDVPGDKRLVAYVVPRPSLPLVARELRSLLNQKLPAGMLPSAFVLLDSLPRTPNGKLDHRALPPPDRLRPELAWDYAAPRTATEQTLAAIWADVLGLDRVGIHDNFFELGGHSLLATRVISRIRDMLHVEVPLRRLFETPTVAGVGLAVVQSRAEQSDPDQVALALAKLEQLSDHELKSRPTHPSDRSR